MRSMCMPLLDTARKFRIPTQLLGVGRAFKEHKERIWILKDYLETVPADDLIVCMDGSDTLFNDSVEVLRQKFRQKNTRILISAEKDFSYQYFDFKDRFDDLLSDYRYVNAGTFMGYAGDLLTMLQDILELNEKFPQANDQGLLGIWAYMNLPRRELVQLDLSCDIFWVTTQDWYHLKEVAIAHHPIINPFTNTQPVIIHSVGNGAPAHRACYDAAYNNIMNG